MKFISILLTLLLPAITLAQTSDAHLENGIAKHTKHDFKGAIKDYDKAIKADKKNTEAYFNRGTCYQALKEYGSAKKDFDKTIKLDAKFEKAYYSRATVAVAQEQYSAAIPDLDKAIEINPKTPNALALRGQLRAQSGDMAGACADFSLSAEHGDPNGSKYLNKFCGNEQQMGESLMLDWPEEENWKLANSQEDGSIALIELINKEETLENWTEMGTMMSIKGAVNIPMDKAMNLMYDQAKLNAKDAKLTFIEKDESVEYPWIIFTIEAPSFNNDDTPESQLWYVIQGKTALYTNFRAIKKAEIPEDLKEKWTLFFKTGKIVTKE